MLYFIVCKTKICLLLEKQRKVKVLFRVAGMNHLKNVNVRQSPVQNHPTASPCSGVQAKVPTVASSTINMTPCCPSDHFVSLFPQKSSRTRDSPTQTSLSPAGPPPTSPRVPRRLPWLTDSSPGGLGGHCGACAQSLPPSDCPPPSTCHQGHEQGGRGLGLHPPLSLGVKRPPQPPHPGPRLPLP